MVPSNFPVLGYHSEEQTKKSKNNNTGVQLYYLEKSSALIRNLITGHGNAKERLYENIVEINLLPEILHNQHAFDLQQKIKKVLNKKDGLYVNEFLNLTPEKRSISAMRNSTASKVISWIYDIHLELRD